MRVHLVYVQTTKEPWVELVSEVYEKKLSFYFRFEQVAVRSRKVGRHDLQAKRAADTAVIKKTLDQAQRVVGLDEEGWKPKGSIDFSRKVSHLLDSGGASVHFVIGGAYGLDWEEIPNLKERWSLGSLTLNHHMARAVFLEQLYRSMTLIKGIPYHN